MSRRRWLRCAWLLAVLQPVMVQADESGPAGGESKAIAEGLDLALMGESTLFRVHVEIEADGQSTTLLWDQAFAEMLSYYDRDGNGALEEHEAARLPSAFALRQVLGGGFAPQIGRAPAWKELDLDGDGAVRGDELAGFYRQAGLGAPLVGVGRLTATAQLSDSLFRQLDADNDDRVDEREWKAAADALLKLDLNDDELVGAGELVSKALYPGASGGRLLLPPGPSDGELDTFAAVPLVVLPVQKSDVYWAQEIVARRDCDADGALGAAEAGLSERVFARLDSDRDERLKSEELVAWRELEPDARWRVCFGNRDRRAAFEDLGGASDGSGAGAVESSLSREIQLVGRTDYGKLPDASAAARKRFLADFEAADSNRDGAVDREECAQPKQGGFTLLVDVADRDGDGKLSSQELEAWLALQERFARCQALISLLDCGQGLFELLGACNDGALSIRELRDAWNKANGAPWLVDGRLERSKLPRHLLITISHGYPVALLGSAGRGGPEWFFAMDRNGDGDVSHREFTGQAALFERLDEDRDGLLSPQEAERLKP